MSASIARRSRGRNSTRNARERARAGALAAMLATAGLAIPGTGFAQFEGLPDDRCVAVILNRVAPVRPDGFFVIPNVPVPLGATRVRVVCFVDDQTIVGHTNFVVPVPNQVNDIGNVFFTEAGAPIPVSMEITAPRTELTPANPSTQLVVTGTLLNGSEVDLTASSTGTTYVSSNPAIARVSNEGLVTAQASGTALFTAQNEGLVAGFQVQVVFSADSDGDGIPDDYEDANSVNPGGSNLSLQVGTTVTASSSSPGFAPERVIDGSLDTSWFTADGDAANNRTTPFIEVQLPGDADVAQVRVFGNRERASGFDFFAGVFRAVDADGSEVFNSGEVSLPAPVRDLAVAVDANGVRRVRFEATDDESRTPGLAEIEIVSRPGGPGLDAGDPDDAALDFDGDGLTNFEEFELGTSIFLTDTDGDRIGDAEELDLGSDPLRSDTDNDGLIDGEERNPTADSDGDGTINLLDADSDNDGLPDGVEVDLGLDPLDSDTNNNGVPDSGEDSDGDGLSNIDELAENLDPGNSDTDGDGLPDGEEVIAGEDGHETDPRDSDSDDDGMSDGFESTFGLDPNDASDRDEDPDDDGLTNIEEFERGTDPFNPDRVPPTVLSTEPPDEADGVIINTAVIIRFSEAMQPSSIDEETVRLLLDGEAVAATVVPSEDRLAATLRSTEFLDVLTTYTLEVSGVRDAAGNLLVGTFTSVFTTSEQGDLLGPVVKAVSPTGTAEPLNSVVVVEFDEPIDPATITDGSFRVRNDRTFVNVAGVRSVDDSGRVVTFAPSSPLGIGAPHRIDVTRDVRDVAGNQLQSQFTAFFTVGFASDTVPPEVLSTAPADLAVNVPLNVIVTVQMSETIDPGSVSSDNVQMEADGEPVAVALSLVDGRRQIRIISDAALVSATLHTVTVRNLRDVAGNVMASPVSFDFTTGADADVVRPTIIALNPPNNTGDIARDTIFTVRFDERISALDATAAKFQLRDNSNALELDENVTIDATGRNVRVSAKVLMQPFSQIRLRVLGGNGGVADFSGNTLQFTQDFFFTTANTSADAQAPSVVAVSPPDGAQLVPVNTNVVVRFSERINPITISSSAVVLQNGAPVAAGLSLSADGRLLTVDPAADLALSTEYTLTLNGLRDTAGNLLPPFNSSFETSFSATADTTRPSPVSFVPSNGATNVPLAQTITVTFSEPLAPTSVTPDTVFLEIPGLSGRVPATVSLDAGRTVVTLDPAQALTASRLYRIRVQGVADTVGNVAFTAISDFTTTSASGDITAPQVFSVNPANDATNVPRTQHVVIVFSEGLHPSTVNADTFALFAGPSEVGAQVFRSADNKVVTLAPFNLLPPNAVITVVATDDVTDLAGNSLADFTSRFTVGDAFDTAGPQVAGVRPPNGATGVPRDASAVLFFTEPIAPASASSGIFVGENGVLKATTIQLTGGNQVAEAVPGQAFAASALGEVFVTAAVTDPSNNPVPFAFRSVFTVESDPSAAAPNVASVFPNCCGPVRRNTVFTARFSEPLDPATITAATAQVLDVTNGLAVPGTGSLDATGTLYRFTPSAPFAAGHRIQFTFTTAIEDLGGTPLAQNRVFEIRPDTETDAIAPTVTTVSPPDGVTGVGVNAVLRVAFSEPINPLTADATTIVLESAGGEEPPCSISIDSTNRLVTITPHGPLATSTTFTVDVDGVLDATGNPVAPHVTTFQTGTGPDVVQPLVLRASPTGVSEPINTVATVEFTEPIDPASVNGDTVALRNLDVSGAPLIPATLELDPSARLVRIIPTVPLAVHNRHRIQVTNGVRDVTGLNLQFGFNADFTTSFDPDSTPPGVVSIVPANGAVGVPRNAVVRVRMSEAIDPLTATAARVRLRAGATAVPVLIAFESGDSVLRLNPATPLAAGTAYTVTVEDVEDRAGNAMTAAFNATFTTEAGLDLIPPSILAINPVNGATGVARTAAVTLVFSERLNPLTVSPATVQLRNNSTFTELPTDVSIDATGTIVTVSSPQPFDPASQIRVRVFGGGSGVRDLAENPLQFTNDFTFTTGAQVSDATPPSVVAVSPPDGTTAVPVNSTAVVRFSEPVNRLTVTSSSVQLTAGGAVPAALSFSSNDTVLTIDPVANLAVSTVHTLELTGVEDVVGNTMAPASFSFTTSFSSTADTTHPFVASFDPSNGANNVPLDKQIVVTFSEPVRPLSVSAENVRIEIPGLSGRIPASVALNGAGTVATIAPEADLLPDKTYRIRVESVFDIAGNVLFTAIADFTTASGSADVTAPAVVDVNPPDGFLDVPRVQSVVLMFSEALDPTTVNGDTFALFAGANELPIQIFRSSDNKVVTLAPNSLLPANREITVVVTSDVTDLAGNPLADFVSSFEVEPQPDQTRPTVAGVRPPNGASNVPRDASVVVFFSEPADPASVADAFLVGENGALKAGTLFMSSANQAAELVPDAPFAGNAFGEIFVTEAMTDAAGNPIQNQFRSVFRVEQDPAALTPDVTAVFPVCCGPVAPNTVFTARFNEPIDVATLGQATVQVRDVTSGLTVPGLMALDASGKVFSFTPDADYVAGDRIQFTFTTGVEDLTGTPLGTNRTFEIRPSGANDATAPTVTSVSPPDGVVDVGTNALLRLAFSEGVNPLTVDDDTIVLSSTEGDVASCSISIDSTNRQVTIIPHSPLEASTTYSIDVAGVTDATGNPVVAFSSVFDTGAGPDLVRPIAVRLAPTGPSEPTNSVALVEFDEPVDPASINASTTILRDLAISGAPTVATTTEIDSSGRIVRLIPSAALEPSHLHRIQVSGGVFDVSGNPLQFGTSADFTTSTSPDATAPQVSATDPADGDTGVPTNALITIRMSEPLNPITVTPETVKLTRGGVEIPGTYTFSDANREIRMRPSELLEASAGHTLTVTDVEDTAGNAMAPAVTRSFTTGAGADLVAPVLSATSVTNGQTGVAVSVNPTLTFSEPLNPITVNGSTILLRREPGFQAVAAQVALNAARTVATVTPDEALAPNTQYRVRINGNAVADKAGNTFLFTTDIFFTTAP